MYPVIHALPWADLQAVARTPLDPAPVRQVAEACLATGRTNRPAIQAALQRDLLATCGPWVAGWCWATSEPGGGGPVDTWCCPSHSVLRADEPRSATVDRVVRSVERWHHWLGLLDAEFQALRDATAELAREEAVEHAAARLVAHTLDRTHAEDAWYGTFALVLTWYLASAGWDADTVSATVHRIASGRFESWIAPDPSTIDATSTELAVEVTSLVPVDSDHTARWREQRESSFRGLGGRGFSGPAADGQLAYIQTVDHARDPARARRMKRALEAARADARKPLTLRRLSAWTTRALGKPATLRTTDAGRGHARYGPLPREELDRWLADAGGDSPPCVRAARVYLDLCHGHPFEDGNGRAARLALAHVLASEGLRLHAAEPVFLLARSSGDGIGGWQLAWVLERLVGSAP